MAPSTALLLALLALFVAWKYAPPPAESRPDAALEAMGVEQVLVLQLARAGDRSKGLFRDAAALKLPLTVMAATDGRLNESFRSRVFPSFSNGTCSDLIGAIFDSHERTWAEAAKAKRPTMVLEDDVRLGRDFLKLFHERLPELPSQESYDMAFLGTSVTPGRRPFSTHLSLPDPDDANKQAILGFWAYMVTPKGARKLLRLAERMRDGGRRSFQPVDLFVAHRLHQLRVMIFEPSPGMASYFQENPDEHHVLKTMRQIGIVTLERTPSMNKPTEDEEFKRISKLSQKVMKQFEESKWLDVVRTSRKALGLMRQHSCWATANVLQNLGLGMLRLVTYDLQGVDKFGGANATLLLAIESFASAIRYNEGTWLERQKRNEIPGWIKYALHHRKQNRMLEAMPVEGWQTEVALPDGGALAPEAMRISEPVIGASQVQLEEDF